MAIIILGKSECPLCGQVLRSGEDIVATPHFLPSGPLSRYSDAGMHRRCFIAWPQAGEFRAAFNDVGPSIWPGRPLQMLEDGSIIDVAPDELPAREEGKPHATVGVLGDVEDRGEVLSAIQAINQRKG